MEQAVVVALVAVGVGVVVALIIFFSPTNRQKRILEAAPVVPISDLRDGQVSKIQGTVVPIDVELRSPVYEEQCVYFFARVRFQEYSTANQGLRWYAGRSMHERRDFIVRDGSGEVHVSVHGAAFHVETVDAVPNHGVMPAPHLVRMLEAVGHPLKDSQGKLRTFGFEEAAIEAGARVEILGSVQSTDGRLMLSAGDSTPLLIRPAP